jgi:hypothetical protein
MMIAYELHRPRPGDPAPVQHELILLARDEGDVMRLMALISMYQHGFLEQALDAAINLLAQQEAQRAHEENEEAQAQDAGAAAPGDDE